MTGHQMAGIYRIEGDWTLIEIKLSETNQLFNSMDPSPFRERDLDPDAAAYVMDALRELHGHARVKLVVYFPGPHDAGLETMIHQSIRNYFSYRERAIRLHQLDPHRTEVDRSAIQVANVVLPILIGLLGGLAFYLLRKRRYARSR